MTHGRSYGFLRPAAQGPWNLRVFPFAPEVHRVIWASEAPALVVPGA